MEPGWQVELSRISLPEFQIRLNVIQGPLAQLTMNEELDDEVGGKIIEQDFLTFTNN